MTNAQKIALITGANKGLGFEMARQIGQVGIIVVVGARDPARGETAAANTPRLGGAVNDQINALTVDFAGYIYATGSTSSPDFPIQWPMQASNKGLMHSFVVKMSPNLSTMFFGTYLGSTAA